MTSETVVAEMDKLLDSATVSVSWLGARQVTVEGYEGSVTINRLAARYLEADPFQRGATASFSERLACHSLWGRVENMYEESDLLATGAFGFVVTLRNSLPEFSCILGDPQAILRGQSHLMMKNAVFQFTEAEFREFWPSESPVGYSVSFSEGERMQRVLATREMVEAAAGRD